MTQPDKLDTWVPDLTRIPLVLLDENSSALATSLRLLHERLDLQREPLYSFNASL
jgi:hypothetical protein